LPAILLVGGGEGMGKLKATVEELDARLQGEAQVGGGLAGWALLSIRPAATAAAVAAIAAAEDKWVQQQVRLGGMPWGAGVAAAAMARQITAAGCITAFFKVLQYQQITSNLGKQQPSAVSAYLRPKCVVSTCNMDKLYPVYIPHWCSTAPLHYHTDVATQLIM
jgi:hypothetical protein